MATTTTSTPTGTPLLGQVGQGSPSLRSDEARWRKYSLAVERALLAFDQIDEWADSHAALARLLKTLQTWPHFNQVPKKEGIALALAHSLDPTLPAGIHARALEVYGHLFETIGRRGLEQDLALYTLGLFPFLQHASTAVKPGLLELLGRYVLDLDPSVLAHVARPLILALLSGMEEDTSDFFEPILALLDRLRALLTDGVVFRHIWSIVLTCPIYRSAAFSVCAKRLPTVETYPALLACCGGDAPLYIRALARALQDDQILVKRAALELLLTNWKLSADIYSQYDSELVSELVNAAISVLLSRDMSLNRRLFAWLLGRSEASEEQIRYFESFALTKLKRAILDDLRAARDQAEAGQTRSQAIFKTLISLLDKHEIGSRLTSALVWDILELLTEQQGHALVPAASGYLEAVEPFLLWQQVARRLVDMHSDHHQVVACVGLLLEIFGEIKDAETSQIHAPASLLLILTPDKAHRYLSLFEPLIQATDPVVFIAQENAAAWDYERAERFYGAESDEQIRSTMGLQSTTTYLALFKALLAICKTALMEVDPLMTQWCRLTLRLVALCPSDLQIPREIADQVREWIGIAFDMKSTLQEDFEHFYVISQTFLGLLSHRLADPDTIHNARVRDACHRYALHHVPADNPRSHHRAILLISKFVEHFGPLHLQQSLLEAMHSSILPERTAALEAFASLWRHNEDEHENSIPLNGCLDAVINFLHFPDLACRRRAEMWLRLGIRSYNKILQPILTDIRICMPTGTDSWSETADLGMLQHRLETCLVLVRYGGQALMKAAKASHLKHLSDASTSDLTEKRMETSLDELLDICHNSLKLEPEPYEEPVVAAMISRICLTSLDILQIVLTRGDLSQHQTTLTRSLIQAKLRRLVNQEELDHQNKLLQLLHLTINASAKRPRSDSQIQSGRSVQNTPSLLSRATMSPSSPGTGKHTETTSTEDDQDDLVDLIILALTRQSNRPILQNWLDCLLMLLAHFKSALCRAVIPISQALQRELMAGLLTDGPAAESFVEHDLVAMMNGLERAVVFLMQDEITEERVQDKETSAERATDSSGIINYVSTMFAGEANTAIVADDNVLNAKLMCFRDVVTDSLRMLHAMAPHLSSKTSASMELKDEALAFSHVRQRLRKMLERFHKLEPQCVYEALIELWYKQHSDQAFSEELFDILQSLATNSQTVLAVIFDAARARIHPMSMKRTRSVSSLTIRNLLKFLEVYVQHLEGPVITLLWNDAIHFFRETISSATLSKSLYYPLMKSFHPMCCKVGIAAGSEDRKIRKDIQELYPRCVDACVTFSGKSSVTSNWIRRGNASVLDSSAEMEEKPDNYAQVADQKQEVEATVRFCAQHVVPEARGILNDPEKTIALFSNIMQFIVTPHLRASLRKEVDADLAVYDLLVALTQHAAMSKAWKPLVLEVFFDPHFFEMSSAVSLRLRAAIEAVVQQDRSILPELLVRASATATIFTSREQESLNRSYSIRRLSYIIFSSQTNSQLPQLVGIQDKIIELIKSPLAASVTIEIYLLLRVMLLRFSVHHLQRLWPIIVSDLWRMVKLVSNVQDPSGARTLSPVSTPMSILSAFKLVNLAMCLQVEDFQLQQWMFTEISISRRQANGICVEQKFDDQQLILLSRVDSLDDLLPVLTKLQEYSDQSVNSIVTIDASAIEQWVENDLLDG